MKIEFKVSKKEKIFIFIILALILAYFLILPAVPYFLFKKKVSKNNISIHYNDNLEPDNLLKKLHV